MTRAVTPAAADVLERDLAAPVIGFLEAQGYGVKSEIRDCDLVAVRGDEPPVVVELKLRFSLELLLQGVDRTRLGANVYLAFPDGPRTTWSRQRKLVMRACRMLGLGILLLRRRADGTFAVVPALDPGPYQPRPGKRRQGRLLKEFSERVGDPNEAGVGGVKLMTAYRQDALRLAHALAAVAPRSPAELRVATNVAGAAKVLQGNVYGWFDRESRGRYRLSPAGREALATYADALPGLIGGVDR